MTPRSDGLCMADAIALGYAFEVEVREPGAPYGRYAGGYHADTPADAIIGAMTRGTVRAGDYVTVSKLLPGSRIGCTFVEVVARGRVEA